MQIKIFTIPIINGEDLNTELNKFLATHKVVDVQQSIVADSYWTFCIKYLDGVKPEEPKGSWSKDSSKKTDYKEVLSEEEFARFTALRAVRKKLATDDAIPAFAVFTDAEIAEMSKLTELTLPGIKAISGIGKGRLEHYGEKLLTTLNETKASANETVQ